MIMFTPDFIYMFMLSLISASATVLTCVSLVYLHYCIQVVKFHLRLVLLIKT